MVTLHHQGTDHISCPELFRSLHGQRKWVSAAERKRAYHLLWQTCNPNQVNANCRTYYGKHGFTKQQKDLIRRLNLGERAKQGTLAKYGVRYDPISACWTVDPRTTRPSSVPHAD